MVAVSVVTCSGRQKLGLTRFATLFNVPVGDTFVVTSSESRNAIQLESTIIYNEDYLWWLFSLGLLLQDIASGSNRITHDLKFAVPVVGPFVVTPFASQNAILLDSTVNAMIKLPVVAVSVVPCST